MPQQSPKYLLAAKEKGKTKTEHSQLIANPALSQSEQTDAVSAAALHQLR